MIPRWRLSETPHAFAANLNRRDDFIRESAQGYIRRTNKPPGFELHDLERDPGETVGLSSSCRTRWRVGTARTGLRQLNLKVQTASDFAGKECRAGGCSLGVVVAKQPD